MWFRAWHYGSPFAAAGVGSGPGQSAKRTVGPKATPAACRALPASPRVRLRMTKVRPALWTVYTLTGPIPWHYDFDPYAQETPLKAPRTAI